MNRNINNTAEKISVPENLHTEISELIDSLDAAEKLMKSERKGPARKIIITVSGIAAAAAILITAGLWNTRTGVPEDTFSDPMLAYAEAEKVLTEISEKMRPAIGQAREAGETIKSHTETIKRLYNKQSIEQQ